MKIAILGATGTFGTALTRSLLNDTEHQLTLISRHAAKGFSSEKAENQ